MRSKREIQNEAIKNNTFYLSNSLPGGSCGICLVFGTRLDDIKYISNAYTLCHVYIMQDEINSEKYHVNCNS